ncbi:MULTISPECIES: hypothetical protein [Streptomycetaceae]|uniref:hypothetical protein n=1 Tax=Streptomycetaceae TaxID=2062 RepID=UPI002DDA60A8|nr:MULTISPECIES: hypothetical protein [Streptomycetaceae]WSD57489.1 hypothetical protein OIE69_00210 [Actinacidiphila glaucinigra]WSD65156.1 hypothetical protein OIE69_43010 [Actinacidiphila glaucinigra]WUB50269.1 hypothetical protein OHN19_43830 [Streptomyces griseorubiginosus]
MSKIDKRRRAAGSRELIVQAPNEGLDTARARGIRRGPACEDGEAVVPRSRPACPTGPENTVTSIAKLLGVSRNDPQLRA